MSHTLPKSHASVILKGGSILPQVNITQCSPACTFYADCLNFDQNQPCKGFKLLQNGNAVNRILQNLSENDAIYVERCMELIPKTTDGERKEMLTNEVLRWLDPNDRHPKKRMFTMRGLDIFEVNEDGSQSIPEPEQPERTAQQPTQPITRNIAFIHQDFPETCTKDCPHVQCSSWGTAQMEGKPCRNRTPTNEELKESVKAWEP